RNPIEAMRHDHEEAGDIFAEIRALLNNYQPPEDACTTMKVTYKELEEFERDLHQHVFLENSILFPKAIDKEAELVM
ncbi:MAG TPA: hemerythrin domain-containing protein, partial [Candidatus Kapabacteria bacterium]|nr:hemerythrin domain-containing protein [Candidatus Kapabacteria bacterium]